MNFIIKLLLILILLMVLFFMYQYYKKNYVNSYDNSEQNSNNENKEATGCKKRYKFNGFNFQNNDILTTVKDNLFFGAYFKLAIIFTLFSYIFLNVYYLHIIGVPIQTIFYNYFSHRENFSILEFPFIIATILILFLKQFLVFNFIIEVYFS